MELSRSRTPVRQRVARVVPAAAPAHAAVEASLPVDAVAAGTLPAMATEMEMAKVMAALADIIIEVFAMDSVLLRTLKLVQSRGESSSALAIAMTQVYLSEAMARIEVAARKVDDITPSLRCLQYRVGRDPQENVDDIESR